MFHLRFPRHLGKPSVSAHSGYTSVINYLSPIPTSWAIPLFALFTGLLSRKDPRRCAFRSHGSRHIQHALPTRRRRADAPDDEPSHNIHTRFARPQPQAPTCGTGAALTHSGSSANLSANSGQPAAQGKEGSAKCALAATTFMPTPRCSRLSSTLRSAHLHIAYRLRKLCRYPSLLFAPSGLRSFG